MPRCNLSRIDDEHPMMCTMMICVCESIRSALLLKHVHTLARVGRKRGGSGTKGDREQYADCTWTNKRIQRTNYYGYCKKANWNVCVRVRVSWAFVNFPGKVEVPCKFDCWLNYPENENEQNENEQKIEMNEKWRHRRRRRRCSTFLFARCPPSGAWRLCRYHVCMCVWCVCRHPLFDRWQSSPLPPSPSCP